MSEPIALETVLRICGKARPRTVTWALEYGLGRHPEAAATIADASLALAEKDSERADWVVLAMRGHEALPKAPDFGARVRRLLPNLKAPPSARCSPNSSRRRKTRPAARHWSFWTARTTTKTRTPAWP